MYRSDGQALLRPIYDELEEKRAGERAAAGAPERIEGDRLDASLWIAAEIEAVARFTKLADELGLPVQGAEYVPRGWDWNKATNLRRYNWELGFDREAGPAFALAQHHGIPSRLLDWTRNPLFAAYFAAEEGERLLREILPEIGPDGADPDVLPTAISVWAIDITRLGPFRDRRYEGKVERELRVLTVPRFQNSFLHAQDGLFIWNPSAARDYRARGEWASFDEVLNQGLESPAPPRLQQVTLPIWEVGALLAALWRERVSRAHLMRAYDNVTRSLTANWERGARKPWICSPCGVTNPPFRWLCRDCGVLGKDR